MSEQAVVLLCLPPGARHHLQRAVQREVALLRRNRAAIPAELIAFLRQISAMDDRVQSRRRR